jgi:uncharacterized protein (TIGR02147 family)
MSVEPEQITVQRLLRRKFEEARAKNPRYSIRAFSRRVGLSASAANEILKGERRISAKMADRIADRLMLNPTERAELLAAFPPRTRRKRLPGRGEPLTQDLLKLSADQFEAIAEWTHFAILSLVRIPGFKDDPKWIATRLGVRPEHAQASLQRLLRMGLIERTEAPDAPFRRTAHQIRTTDDVLSLSIQRSHLDDLERMAHAIRELPVTERDASSMTMPANPALFPQAKAILRRAQNEIDALMEASACTEVIRVFTCLYPLTRTHK